MKKLRKWLVDWESAFIHAKQRQDGNKMSFQEWIVAKKWAEGKPNFAYKRAERMKQEKSKEKARRDIKKQMKNYR